MTQVIVNLSLLLLFLTAGLYGYLIGFIQLLKLSIFATISSGISLLIFLNFSVIPVNFEGSILATSLFVISSVAIFFTLNLAARSISRKVNPPPKRRLEDDNQTYQNSPSAPNGVAGAICGLFALIAFLWIITFSFESGALPVDKSIRENKILAYASKSMPEGFGDLLLNIEGLLVKNGIGRYSFSAVEPTLTRDTPEDTEAYWATKHLHGSIPLIRGVDRCTGDNIKGTGILISESTVVTNAHVVAGLSRVVVNFPDQKLLGEVVAFNTEDDIAVLRINKSRSGAIPIYDGTPKLDDKGFIVGYPEGGPIDARGSVITRLIDLKSKDIYGINPVHREVLEIKSLIRHGNSGGPLLNTNRELVGMVYAINDSSKNQGYAIRLEEIKEALKGETNPTVKYKQQKCITR